MLLVGDFLRYCVVRDARGAANRESGTRRFLGSASPLVFSDIGALLGVEEKGSKQRYLPLDWQSPCRRFAAGPRNFEEAGLPLA